MAEYSKISNLIKELKDAESVDICFLVDCTSSMDPYIDQVKTIINSALIKLKSVYKNIKLRFSFIGYRDYDKKGNDLPNRILTSSFTSDIAQFEKFVTDIKPTGGGDGCEDVFGGLEQVPKLEWKNKSRVLLHICDAPCHGSKFHDLNISDDHPKGDPKGLKISDLLKTITNLNIQYYFTEINSFTPKMIEQFNLELDLIPESSQITVFKLKNATDLLDTLTTSVTLTISYSQTMTMTIREPRPLKDKIVDKSKLNFETSDLKEHDAEFFTFEFTGDLTSFQKLMVQHQAKGNKIKLDNFVTVKRQTVKVKLCEVPFAKGNLRFAYASLVEKNGVFNKFVAKNSLYVDEKKDSYPYIKQSVMLQIVSKYLAEKFIIDSKSEMSVRFLNVYLMQLIDTGEYYAVEDYLEGKFSKWSNNLGYVNEKEYSFTLDAFSHWTYEKTNSYLIVSDLQGFKSGNGEYVLTDPAISSVVRQFTSTDLGGFGIMKYFEKHMCNSHCVDLGLTRNAGQPVGVREENDKTTKLKRRK